MVSFGWEIFLLCRTAAMLTFFIAGLLFICALSTSITWERTPHPVRRPAFSSHLLAQPRLVTEVSCLRLERIASFASFSTHCKGIAFIRLFYTAGHFDSFVFRGEGFPIEHGFG